MGLFTAIRDALIRPFDPRPGQDKDREEIESSVAALTHQREEADAKISGWRRQADEALRHYKPGLLDPLQEARENLGRPIERGKS